MWLEVALGITKIYLIWAGFAVIERLIPATGTRGWRFMKFNFVFSLSALGLSIWVIVPVVVMLVDPIKQTLGGYALIKASLFTDWFSPIGSTLLYLFLFDFFYYWFHRLQHTWTFLWSIHILHHSDYGLNVTTSLRVHWLEELARVFFVAWPMVILTDLTPVHVGVAGFVFSLWIFFIHANIRLHLGLFSVFLCGPQVHRIHHSLEQQHQNKNFAAFFPIWDRLFGTYWSPEKNEYPETGLPSGEKMDRFWQANLYPFIAWWQAIRLSRRAIR